jgi:hypothetical protein
MALLLIQCFISNNNLLRGPQKLIDCEYVVLVTQLFSTDFINTNRNLHNFSIFNAEKFKLFY